MTATPNLYAVLGVSPESDDVVIRAAFKAVMLKYHPDTNKSADATRRAAAINAAFAVLGDPEKRAAYDQSFTRRPAEPSKGYPPPPTSPKPPPSSAATKPSPVRKESSGAGPMVVLAVVVILGTWGLASTGKHSPSVTTDTTITDMGSDAAISDHMTAADMMTSNDMTEMETSVALSNLLIASPAGPASTSLTPLAFDDIEGAAKDVDRVLQSRGIQGARAFSVDCHKTVAAQPSWAGADRCAAFDYAAAYLDAGVSEAGGIAKNAYFVFQRDNQNDYYNFAGYQSYLARQRLEAIRETAETAVVEIVRSRLASSSRPGSPEGPPSSARKVPLESHLDDTPPSGGTTNP